MRSATTVDADLVGEGRPSDHGRRADLRVGRRLQVGGMEYGRARPDQAYPRRRTDPAAARPLRAGRSAALRPGQVVSRRGVAALGVLAVLATDGVPVWRDPAADRARSGDATPADGDAQRFACGVAARLGIAAGFVQPAFEDPADRMQKEGDLPDNVDPDKSQARRSGGARPDHAPVRASPGAPAGFVLPVQRWTAKASPAGSAKSGARGAGGFT